MIAPVIGLGITAATFGLSEDLRRMAMGMALLALLPMGLLLRAEMRRQATMSRRSPVR